MSARNASTRRRSLAPAFAALGDETRLALLARLSAGRPMSITQLTEGSQLTRQAITKHLRVLEQARIAHSVPSGRERLFQLDPRSMHDMREYLDTIGKHWDQALLRLKTFVEDRQSN